MEVENISNPTGSGYKPSKWAGVGTGEYKQIMDSFQKKIAWYRQQLLELRDSLENGDVGVEERQEFLKNRCQELSLTLALDLSTALQFELDKGSTSYYEKVLGSFKNYLRDVREDLKMFISVESM